MRTRSMPKGSVHERLKNRVDARAAAANAAPVPGVEFKDAAFWLNEEKTDGQVVVQVQVNRREFDPSGQATTQEMVEQLLMDEKTKKKILAKRTEFHANAIADAWTEFMQIKKKEQEEAAKHSRSIARRVDACRFAVAKMEQCESLKQKVRERFAPRNVLRKWRLAVQHAKQAKDGFHFTKPSESTPLCCSFTTLTVDEK